MISGRRDALKALSGLAACTGLSVTPVTTEAADGVELIIVKVPRRLRPEEAACFLQQWKLAVEGTSLAGIQAVVLDDGIEIEIVRKFRGGHA